MHACRPKRLPLVLGVEVAEGLCSSASKFKLPTTHNHHYHHNQRRRRRRCRHHHNLLLQLLLKVLIMARIIFKRRDPGASEDGAEDVIGFSDIAMKDLTTHACPHASL